MSCSRETVTVKFGQSGQLWSPDYESRQTWWNRKWTAASTRFVYEMRSQDTCVQAELGHISAAGADE